MGGEELQTVGTLLSQHVPKAVVVCGLHKKNAELRVDNWRLVVLNAKYGIVLALGGPQPGSL